MEISQQQAENRIYKPVKLDKAFSFLGDLCQ